MSIVETQIKFVVGSRKLFAVPRQLDSLSFTLDHLLGNKILDFAKSADAALQGYRILSAPIGKFSELCNAKPGYVVGGFQSYRRCYIDMAGSYSDYLARFSSKTRSTFNRKKRKLAEHSGGELDIREFRSPDEMEAFLAEAIPLSRKTYQARLLDAGLPESEDARNQMLALARADCVRAYLLFVGDKAVSYLYLPIEDGIISYAFLGYDPQIANLSPGTVLQLDALERLFVENRYRYFDFTEGEGAHKAMFGTDSVAACSFFLLKGSVVNRTLLGCLAAFDGSINACKRVAEKSGVQATLRRVLKG